MISDILSALIKKVNQYDEEIEDLEAIIADRKAYRDRILQDDIPTVLHENGLTSAPLADGRTITIERVVNVSQLDKALLAEWLKSHEYDSIIRTSFEFGKGADTSALEALLAKEQITYQKESSVHPMSLKKVISDHLSEGGDYPPEEAAKVSVFERAKVKGGKE
jgi:hypothetical protein